MLFSLQAVMLLLFHCLLKQLGARSGVRNTPPPAMSSSSNPPLKTGAQVALCVGALGVVFGDIGTSPLYALSSCLSNLPPALVTHISSNASSVAPFSLRKFSLISRLRRVAASSAR